MVNQFVKDMELRMAQNRIIHKCKDDKEYIEALYKNEPHLRNQIKVIAGYEEVENAQNK